MTKKIISNCVFITACTFFAFVAFSENDSELQTPQSKAKEVKYPSRDNFDMSDFEGIVQQKIIEVKGNFKSKGILMKWKGIKMMSTGSVLAQWAKHPYIEEATKIKKSWYAKLSRLLKSMSKLKIQMRIWQREGDDRKYKEAEKGFMTLAKKCAKVLKKPYRIKKNKRRRH